MVFAAATAARRTARIARQQQRQSESRKHQDEQRVGSNPAHKQQDSTIQLLVATTAAGETAEPDRVWQIPATIPHGRNLVRYLIILLAVAGIVVSGLALKVHYDTGSEPCRLNDKWDCGVVNHSPYAMIGRVPVAAIGIVGYLLIGVLGLMRRRGLLLVCGLIGLGFALYLTNIEARVLGVWCLYCVISQGIIAVLTLLAVGWFAWAKLRNRAAA